METYLKMTKQKKLLLNYLLKQYKQSLNQSDDGQKIHKNYYGLDELNRALELTKNHKDTIFIMRFDTGSGFRPVFSRQTFEYWVQNGKMWGKYTFNDKYDMSKRPTGVSNIKKMFEGYFKGSITIILNSYNGRIR